MKKIIKQNITSKTKFFIPLMLLFIALFFCISTVSAADNDTIYVNGSNGNDSWDGLSWAAAKLTIKNATGTINANGTIHIAKGQYKGTNNTNLTINKNMSIIGESQTGTTINGEDANWIFNIASGVNVTIQNLTLTNGKATNGGAIFNRGNLTINDCTFADNTATSVGGGAIVNFGSMDVADSIFTGNTASVNGGAINNQPGSNSTVSGSTFNGNSAPDGGAISCLGSANVTGSTFTSNTANGGFGGAIASAVPLTVTSSTFTGNTASTDGGAIWSTDTCTVQLNRIVGNIATVGSAIYSDGSCDANYNWWGSNLDPKSITNLIAGQVANVNTTTWVILTVTANPTNINNTKTSTITADFNHINGGGDLIGGHIPDGYITLDIPWGSFTSPGINHSFTANTVAGVMTASFYANEGAVNPLFNPVMVTATADGYTTNDTESAYITINPAADISVNKTFEDTNHNHITRANYQDTVVIHLNVTNNGPDMANWVVINDIIPPELDDSSFDITSNSPAWGYVYYSGSQRLTIYIADIANGASYDVWINVTNIGHDNSLITNTARLNTTETYPYDPNPDNNNSTDSYTAKAAADVSITTEFRNNPWGDIITSAHYNDRVYAIVHVSNRGPDSTSLSVLDSLTGITWTGTYYVLPYLIPNIQSNWIINDTTNTFNGTHWNIPYLGSGLGGTEKWLAIEGIISQTGTSNYAETVDQSAYPYQGYDSYTAYLTVNAAPTNLTIDNASGNKYKTITLKATLKDYLHNPLSGKTVGFWVEGVKVGESTTDINGLATFNYNINLVGGMYNITAQFLGDAGYMASNGDGTLKVNQSSVYVLTTTSKTNPTVGETITLTFKLGNNGPDPADDVVFTYVLPEDMEFVSLETEPGYPKAVYDPETRTMTWNLGTVPILDPWLKLNVRVLRLGIFNANPTVTTTTYDPTLGNDIQQVTINAASHVKAASNTIPMQKTGLPISKLILGILAVFSGLTASKISNFGGSKNRRFFSTSKRK